MQNPTEPQELKHNGVHLGGHLDILFESLKTQLFGGSFTPQNSSRMAFPGLPRRLHVPRTPRKLSKLAILVVWHIHCFFQIQDYPPGNPGASFNLGQLGPSLAQLGANEVPTWPQPVPTTPRKLSKLAILGPNWSSELHES